MIYNKDKHGINILPVHFIFSAINGKHDKEIESFLLSYWGLSTLAGNIYILIIVHALKTVFFLVMTITTCIHVQYVL